jgi:hypothetical protein
LKKYQKYWEEKVKKVFHLGIVLAFLLALVPVGAMAHTEEEPFEADLLAGQEIDVGDVLVWNDADNLYVKFVIGEGADWCITETHLHVAMSLDAIPQKNGNPIPGQFEYKDEQDCVSEFQYVIPLTWDVDTELYIAAHAVVLSPIEGCSETVWQIGDVEVVNATTGWLENYADEFNWGDPAGPTTPGPNLGQEKPAFTNPFIVDTTPVEEFPFNSNTNQNYATDFDVQWNGALPFGGELTLSWSPGQSATEKKVVSDGFPTATFTEEGTPSPGEGWFLDIYPLVENSLVVDPLPSGTHTINFQHTQGDGTYWDWIQLMKPCEQEETAWGDGTGFPGKNWATYFNYTVQETDPVMVDTVIVPSDGTTVNSIALESGKSYLLEASGTYTYWPAQLLDAGIADAKFSLRPQGSYNPGPGPQWISGDDLPGSVQYYLQVWVNGSPPYWQGDFNEDHIYSIEIIGTGTELSFKIIDDHYGDNSGSLTVDIYELP